MNALYDPRVLYDYGGPIFDHKNVKLVQRHITDTSGTLIPPWLEYEKLRTGTVVLIRLSKSVPHTKRILNPKGFLPDITSSFS